MAHPAFAAGAEKARAASVELGEALGGCGVSSAEAEASIRALTGSYERLGSEAYPKKGARGVEKYASGGVVKAASPYQVAAFDRREVVLPLQGNGVTINVQSGPQRSEIKAALDAVTNEAFRAAVGKIVAAYAAKPAKPEWIEWAGGECPIADEYADKWEMRHRTGETFVGCMPSGYASQWDHTNPYAQAHIVAYRVLP
jgi:hypothetical protein